MAFNGKICATCKQHKGYEFFFLMRKGAYAPSCVVCTPKKVKRAKVDAPSDHNKCLKCAEVKPLAG